MTSKPAVLYESAAVPVAETTIIASPANILTIVNKFSGCNTSASALTVTVKIVKSGDTLGSQHIVLPPYTILAGDRYGFPELVGQALAPGDYISVLPSAAGLNLRSSGTLVAV